MEELSMEKFNPKKAELIAIAEQYKSLEIKGIDDVAGYAIIDEARKDLKRKRVEIEKTGKALRSEAIAFQKAVISYEDGLVQIIEPLEKELKAKQDAIDNEKKIAERFELLPERKAKLAEINITLDDQAILEMDNTVFATYFIDQKTLFLAEKERKMKEEQEKIEREKQIEEAKKQARIEAEKQAEIDKVNALKLAEEQKAKALAEAKEKAEAEKQAIIDENERKEKARIEAERLKAEKEKQEAEAKRLEEEKLAKLAKYKKFLKDNEYDETENFALVKKETKVILYKKIAEYTL